MKPILMIGTSIVNIALIAYSIFIYNEIKYRKVTSKLLTFLTIGVALDIIATICMIIGSSKGPFTLHGLLGYSSLLAMLIDAIIIWNFKHKQGANATLSTTIHQYSVLAYCWWITAYITGAMLVFLFR